MYEPFKGKQVRTFKAFMEPSVADPAHVISVVELGDDGTTVTYCDTDVLRQVADDIDNCRFESAVRQKVTNEVLKALGIDWREYMEKLSASRREVEAIKAAEKIPVRGDK